MPEDESIWQSILGDPDSMTSRGGDEIWRALSPASRARLLDAAIVVVRAARDLATVAEEVLTDRRDRIGQKDQAVASRQDDTPVEGRIDLTY